MSKKIKDKLLPIIERIAPMVKVAERVAQVAVHIQKPTMMGVAMMASSGLSALHDVLGNGKSPGWQIEMYLSRGQIAEAVEAAGGLVKVIRYSDGTEYFECSHAGVRFAINPNGSVSTSSNIEPEFIEWLRQAIDRSLPAAIDVRRKQTRREHGGGSSYEAHPIPLTQHDNAQAVAIMKSTMPLLGGGRCILLDGKPGVGKTTMAQIIAREAKLGRTVILDGTIIGHSTEFTGEAIGPTSSGADIREALQLLSPGVIIIDDIDKLRMSLNSLEALRSAAKLVILTANNGAYDEVLDGATTRAGRVDESFTIEPVGIRQDPPFNLLSDEEWAEVSQWPIAYLNEVHKRLTNRPNDLRLDDLRKRLTKKTRSGDVLR